MKIFTYLTKLSPSFDFLCFIDDVFDCFRRNAKKAEASRADRRARDPVVTSYHQVLAKVNCA